MKKIKIDLEHKNGFWIASFMTKEAGHVSIHPLKAVALAWAKQDIKDLEK